MTAVTQNRVTVGIALAIPCAVALWLLTPAGAAVSSTYVFVALLVAATALIGLNTWHNGQPASSMRQALHDADLAASIQPAANLGDQTSAARWAAWQLRGDAAAEVGRVRALLGFSLIVTVALLFVAWLA
jgi:hypothetical protein